MAMSKQHRILIASDGSRPAQAALAMALKFPWSSSSSVRAVVARSSWLPARSERVRAAVEKSFEDAGTAARRALASRWPESRVVFIDAPPIDAILAEAKRFKASLIVLGWRGHKQRYQEGQAIAAAGAARLERSGWTVKSEVCVGAPLASLLKAVAEHRADVLVLGARGTSRLAPLGSVANGALNSSSVVLLVR